jgi:RNA polymerase sigma-70 factor, ECF subfamily
MIREPATATAPTDAELMGRVAAGDVRAFEAIYDRHHRQAFALANRIVGRTGGAEEATQDAFVSLWRSAAAFEPRLGSLRSWLLAVVRNRSIDLLRKGAQRADHDVFAELAAERIEAPERTDETVIAMQEYRDARRLLEDLPREQREAIDLAYMGGYTQSEIAAFVGVPLGTVKGRTRLGLLKLRSAAGQEAARAQTARNEHGPQTRGGRELCR